MAANPPSTSTSPAPFTFPPPSPSSSPASYPARSPSAANVSNPLNAIALISGGKDSFFALYHCLALGHRVVALAHLHPAVTPGQRDHHDKGQHDHHDKKQRDHHAETSTAMPSGSTGKTATLDDTELNSYMYQTAGHTLVALYAQALRIPLYTAPILGTAVQTAKEYTTPLTTHKTPNRTSFERLEDSTDRSQSPEAPADKSQSPDGDETESLIPLLQDIMRRHPEANALSSGAILSTYQRTRIESVCLRLGLTPLAYLWQYPSLTFAHRASHPAGLLDDIADLGLDARIVKVASGGLDAGFLWQSLGDARVRRRVSAAVNRFGGSALGEGGEFETLVISGPPGLWQKSIEVSDDQMAVQTASGGEAWLTFHGGRCVPLSLDEGLEPQKWLERIHRPELWTGLIAQWPGHEHIVLSASTTSSTVRKSARQLPKTWEVPVSVRQSSRSLHICNLTARTEGTSIGDQAQDVVTQLQSHLSQQGYRPEQLTFVTLILRSMTDFAAVNAIYSHVFPRPLPPARVTVACGDSLPSGCLLMLSAIGHKDEWRDRQGLHVQSRSYWAPANIGPYSQAVSIRTPDSDGPRLIYVAGQIPLVPATMEILDDRQGSMQTFEKQARLSLQHLQAVGKVMQVQQWLGAIAFVASATADDDQDTARRAAAAASLWTYLHRKSYEQQRAASMAEDEGGDAGADSKFDVWDLKMGLIDNDEAAEHDDAPLLPDYRAMLKQVSSKPAFFDEKLWTSIVPPFFAIEVTELPRNSQIEWQSIGLAGARLEGSAWRQSHDQNGCSSIYSADSAKCEISFSGCWNSNTSTSPSALSQPYKDSSISSKTRIPQSSLENLVDNKDCSQALYTTQPHRIDGASAVTVVPCKRIWNVDGHGISELVVAVTEHCPDNALVNPGE